MGKQGNSMRFNESFLKETSMKSMNKTNGLATKERDYMISAAMRRLGISDQWHNAVARGACYLDGAKFWELVDIASSKNSPAHYFVACIGKEIKKYA